MTKKELNEIKKLYKKDNSIRNIAGCYVNAEKEIISTFQKTFLNIDEDEFYKYLSLFKKGLSGTIGKTVNTYPMEDNAIIRSLIALRNSDLKDEEMLQSFYLNVIEQYMECENYAILLINNVYDVVYKGADGFKNTEYSDSTYSYIQVLICPVKLEKPGLVYKANESFFAHKDTRWELQMPVCGMLYPSFEERTEDSNFITCYTKKTDGSLNSILENVFGIDINMTPDEQTELIQEIISEVLKDRTEKIDVLSSIQRDINIKIKEAEGTLELNKDTLKDILEDNGIESDKLNLFEEKFIAAFGNAEISAKNIFTTNKLEIKTPDITLKVKADKNRDIQTKIVDGKKCLVIAMEPKEEIEVNGVII